MNDDSVTVLGAGSWGTALAIRLAHNHNTTVLWGHEPHFMAGLQDRRENTQYLPGIELPDNLLIESDLASAVGRSRDLLIVVPSHALREVVQHAAAFFTPRTRIAWATKGLETGTGKFMQEVIEEVLGTATRPPCCPARPLQGGRGGLPTALTVASFNPPFANDMAAGCTARSCVSTPATTSLASSWAALSRTCSPSLPASPTGSGWAPTAAPHSLPGAGRDHTPR